MPDAIVSLNGFPDGCDILFGFRDDCTVDGCLDLFDFWWFMQCVP